MIHFYFRIHNHSLKCFSLHHSEDFLILLSSKPSISLIDCLLSSIQVASYNVLDVVVKITQLISTVVSIDIGLGEGWIIQLTWFCIFLELFYLFVLNFYYNDLIDDGFMLIARIITESNMTTFPWPIFVIIGDVSQNASQFINSARNSIYL